MASAHHARPARAGLRHSGVLTHRHRRKPSRTSGLRPRQMDVLTRQGETMSVPETIDSRTHRVRWRREPGCRPRGTACERRAARRAGHRRAGQVAHQHGARSPGPTRGRRPGRERGARTKDSRAPAHSLSRHPGAGPRWTGGLLQGSRRGPGQRHPRRRTGARRGGSQGGPALGSAPPAAERRECRAAGLGTRA